MIYIVEGTDGSGKSTVAREIVAQTRAEYLHTGAPSMPHLVEYTAPLVPYEGKDVVLDRWHLGERVYGTLYRGGCGLTPIAWAAVEAFLAERGCIVLLTHAPVQTLCDRLTSRGELPDRAKLMQEKSAFDRTLTWTNLPCYTYDTEKPKEDIPAMVERLVTIAAEQEATWK
jgi:thymidylate kinase